MCHRRLCVGALAPLGARQRPRWLLSRHISVPRRTSAFLKGRFRARGFFKPRIAQIVTNRAWLRRGILGSVFYQSLFEIGLFTTKEGNTPVSAVLRLAQLHDDQAPSLLRSRAAARSFSWDGELPGNWRWRATRERQRPRWLRWACRRAEEDLGFCAKERFRAREFL